MKSPIVFGLALFLAAVFAYPALAYDKGHRGGGHRGGDKGHRGGDRGGGMRQKRESPRLSPANPGRQHRDLKPGKDEIRGHVRRHYHSRDHLWFRSRWSFCAGTGGLGFYYGGWDSYLSCHPYFYPRSHYYPRSWAAWQVYSYWYDSNVVCPVHGFYHLGHCEWYYHSDGGMVLFWYP